MPKQKLLGIVLILLGLACSGALILYSLHHAEYMWHTEMKSQSFSTFAEYYFSISKGALLFSDGIGAIFIGSGICFLNKHRS